MGIEYVRSTLTFNQEEELPEPLIAPTMNWEPKKKSCGCKREQTVNVINNEGVREPLIPPMMDFDEDE